MNESRTVERFKVDSSGLAAVGYDEHRSLLSIEFTSGAIFHYYDVPLHVFEELGLAESRGKFYAQRIRGKFTGRPMTGKCPQCGGAGLIGEHCNAELKHDEFCDGIVREIDRTHKD